MEGNLQDEILVFEDYEEYNIAYPVIITRWEIKQVHGLNKQYLQVYFQKLNDNVKAFQLNIACVSAFGKEVERLSDVSIQEVDKKEIEFSSVIPLHGETRRVEIAIGQCLLNDGSIVEKCDKKMITNSFKPFAEEDRTAAQRLLPTAKGYPMDSATHWYCACGALHNAESDSCERCQRSKQEIFLRVTPEKIQEEKNKETSETKIENKKRVFRGILISVLGFISFVTLFFPILQVNEVNIVVHGFNINKIQLSTNWDAVIFLSIFQLLFSFCTMVAGVLTIFCFSAKTAKKISVGVFSGCLLIMLIYFVFGFLILKDNKFLIVTTDIYERVHYKFSSSLYNSPEKYYNTKSFFWFGGVIDTLLIIAYLILIFIFNRNKKIKGRKGNAINN